MGCCGGLSSSATGMPPINALPPEGTGQRYMQSGENPECWAARTQSTPDKEGAAPPEGKIITASIAAACDLTFEQQIDALPPKDGTTTSWDAPVWKPDVRPGITWSATGNNGKFTGKFHPDDEKVEFSVIIGAHFSDGTSDVKTYTLKPMKCNPDDDSITFTNPHPTGQQSAPFGEVRPASGGGTRAHQGLDFGNGGKGGPIVAAADGKVIRVNDKDYKGGGYGYNVLIQHSTKAGKPLCNTFYAHLASICVTDGAKVAKGQTIGQCGGSGATPPYAIHLHFELHINGVCKDPAQYITPPVKHQVGSDSKPLYSGDIKATVGNSNYGATPPVGTTTRGPDGYQTTPNPNANKGKAINQGTVDMAGKQCEGTSEPPLKMNDPDTPVVGNDPPCVDMLTLEQLQKMVPTCGNNCNRYLAGINSVLKSHVLDDLTDKCGPEARKRVAMFIAQCAAECDNFRGVTEYGNDSYFLQYEGRNGNNQPGDGPKYKGRGLIHVTGKANYRDFGSSLNRKDEILEHPELLASDITLAALSAGWFWKKNKLNPISGDINAATKRINGGYNGLAKRETNWKNGKAALQIA